MYAAASRSPCPAARLTARSPTCPACARQVTARAAKEADEQYGIVAQYPDRFRALPVAAGAGGFVALLANRFLSGAAPVVDAGSSQSRVDVLVIAMAASLALTGFQWLTLKPVEPKQVEPTGSDVFYVRDGLKAGSRAELTWAWESLRDVTCCRSLVVLHSGVCVLQAGLAASGCTPGRAAGGPICKAVMKQGKANYLANLTLFPGRIEFAEYLPGDLSAAIIAPIGASGVLIAAGDTQRGFSRIDQAWISTIADKLEDTLEVNAPSGLGFR